MDNIYVKAIERAWKLHQDHLGDYEFEDCGQIPCGLLARGQREIRRTRGPQMPAPKAKPDMARIIDERVDGRLFEQNINGRLTNLTRRVAGAHEAATNAINAANDTARTVTANANVQIQGHNALAEALDRDRARLSRVEKERYELDESVRKLVLDVEALTLARQTATAAAATIERDGLPLRFEDAEGIAAAVYGRLRVADEFVLSADNEIWGWERARHHVGVADVLARMYSVAAAREDEARLTMGSVFDPSTGIITETEARERARAAGFFDNKAGDSIKLRDVTVKHEPAGIMVTGVVPGEYSAALAGPLGDFSMVVIDPAKPVVNAVDSAVISPAVDFAIKHPPMPAPLVTPARNEVRGTREWHDDRGHPVTYQECPMNACRKYRIFRANAAAALLNSDELNVPAPGSMERYQFDNARIDEATAKAVEADAADDETPTPVDTAGTLVAYGAAGSLLAAAEEYADSVNVDVEPTPDAQSAAADELGEDDSTYVERHAFEPRNDDDRPAKPMRGSVGALERAAARARERNAGKLGGASAALGDTSTE